MSKTSNNPAAEIRALALAYAKLKCDNRPMRMQLIRMTALAQKHADRNVTKLLREMEAMVTLDVTNNAAFDDLLDVLEVKLGL